MTECCVCFVNLPDTSELCESCVPLLKEVNEQGYIIHPVTRKPLRICVCGKLWNSKCRSQTVLLLGPVFIGDDTKLRPNDPAFNRAYALNPAKSQIGKADLALPPK
jgi:hypothetical protein